MKPVESFGNRLLDSLSRAGSELLMSRATEQVMALKAVLYAEYERPAYAYLPLTGVASVVAITSKGESAEAGFIGCEGMVGATHVLGPARVPTRCFVQIEGLFLRIPFADLVAAHRASEELRSRMSEFIQVDMLTLSQMAGCNQMHGHEARLARWLLMAADRSKSVNLAVTHEIMAEMIGARRTTVSLIAAKLQRHGLIAYKRGLVDILDRKGLEHVACECYGIAKALFQGLYNHD